MWSLTINGVDFYHIINWFFVYSFLGWLWETSYVSIKKGKFVNRGFINGPFCTIYGCGAVSVYLILMPVAGNLLWLYLGGIVVATTLEYVTAVVMESIFHMSWWDYSDKKFNFQGRICLGASLGWGLFTVALFRILHPMVEYFVALYPVYEGEIGICVIVVGYAVDFGVSAAAAFHLRERIPVWEQALDELQAEMLVKMHQRLDSMAEASGLSRERLRGIVTDKLEDVSKLKEAAILKELDAKRASMMKELTEEIQSRKEAMAKKLGPVVLRIVKSYPDLILNYRLHHKNQEQKKDEKKED